MKKTLLLALSSVAFPILSWADLTFVQDVEMQGQKHVITLKSKDTKLRIDIGKQMSMLLDIESGEMTSIMHEQKSFMKMDPSTVKMMQAKMKQQAGAEAEPIELKPTGEKEKIGKYDTEIYTTEADGVKGRFWIAKNFPKGEKVLEVLKKIQDSPAGSMAGNVASQPKSYPGVPVKSEIEVGSGQKAVSNLVSVNDDTIDASEFVAPKDYNPLSIPALPMGE